MKLRIYTTAFTVVYKKLSRSKVHPLTKFTYGGTFAGLFFFCFSTIIVFMGQSQMAACIEKTIWSNSDVRLPTIHLTPEIDPS